MHTYMHTYILNSSSIGEELNIEHTIVMMTFVRESQILNNTAQTSQRL